MVLLAQGIFYLLTGIWPLVSTNTFQKVTGPKQDLWLVRTAGVWIAKTCQTNRRSLYP
jgi:hypothetical protein